MTEQNRMAELLKYGTDMHTAVKDAILERYKLSRQQMTKFDSTWTKVDDSFRMYLPAKTEDVRRKSKRDVKGQPQYTDIVVPYSYAILMSAHMYWSSVFLSRSPVFQWQSQSGELERTAYALEALFDYQLRKGNLYVPLSGWLLDMGKYGVGVVGNYWDNHKSRIVQWVDEPATTPDGVIDPNREAKKTKKTTELTTYEGNRLFNVRPRNWLPDPRVPLVDFQRGEFCGHITYLSGNDIARSDTFFNKSEVKRAADSQNLLIDNQTGQTEPPLRYSFQDLKFAKDGATIIEMQIDLIPKLWKLGDSEKPEKWVFTLANQEVIIGATPLGRLHDMFTYHIQQYEIEVHDFVGRGLLELLQPMNDGATWLLNSHFWNIRKALNDNFIYDPQRIVAADLEGGPGRAIRIRPLAYGTSIDQVFKQLPVADVTQQHIPNLQVLADFMQRVSGVMDSVMGMLSPHGRKTATEVRNAGTFSTNRLKVQAEFNSALGWSPLASMMLSNTQELMSMPVRLQLAGQMVAEDRYMTVTPENIAGQYDFVPVDGTLPIDRTQQSMMLGELMKAAAQFGPPPANPIFAQYDVAAFWVYAAQLMGVKNTERFRVRQIAPIPDAALADQVKRGNMIPMPGNGITQPGSGAQIHPRSM